MRRPRKNPSLRLSSDSRRLIALALATSRSASRLEERSWEKRLDEQVRKVLKTAHQNSVDAALESLFRTDLSAYDSLIDSIEALSESCQVIHDGVVYDALLVAAPILVWTRFEIPAGALTVEQNTRLAQHLSASLLAPGTLVHLVPQLLAIDQLPETHAQAFALTQQLAAAALSGNSTSIPFSDSEVPALLGDTRYIVGVIAAPVNAPFFRWETEEKLFDYEQEIERALIQWRSEASPILTTVLAGCGYELLLPEAYYIACREADKAIRPILIKSAVHFLVQTLGIEAGTIRATIGGFGTADDQERIDEYRISFSIGHNPEVVYGVIWPIYEEEDTLEDFTVLPGKKPFADETEQKIQQELPMSTLEEIYFILRKLGVTHIKKHKEHFAIESCEDCGAPLFADFSAELVHAEMPEIPATSPSHFH